MYLWSNHKSQDETTTNYEQGVNIGALIEESDGINSPIRYFYDSSSGRLLATLQNGEGLTYTYDDMGRMTSVKPATGTSSSYSAVNNAQTVNYTYNSSIYKKLPAHLGAIENDEKAIKKAQR